ncbi:MAG: DUF4118 domain-containing protein, partial [Phycisphaerales bacterium]|nr:DUF4118 domain-containing protein [Phycisphaerales bacterium]
MPPDARPEPDEVLARFKQGQTPGTQGADAEGRARGRLKIFLGMAPGVGKTYAMLEEAQRLAGRGVDVVVGVVETHGRAETERMLLGLDILPRRAVAYGAATLSEFDTEAATGRRPDVLLVDELAHSNAPGSPRQKRWQDVLACLDAGVDVYTTLNVQHIESLNDVVAQITGVKVGETVPDRVFDEADEVELVDLPPDALRERLRAGKVYTGEGAARAVDPADGFFRKGNLAALRELALRRTAAWVDSDMRRYRRDRGIRALWPAAERIVVAVSPSPMSGRVIRAAKRMAAGLHAELIAVHARSVDAPDLPGPDRDRLAEHLRLAESLGATTATVRGPRAAAELIAFARSRNCGRIVVGKTDWPRWREALSGSFVDELIRGSGDIDIYVVRGDDASDSAQRESTATTPSNARARRLWRFPAAVAVVGAGALVAWPMYRPPDLSEEALVLLGSVVLAALWFGRGAAIAASVAAVLAFNFLFTEPRYTFLFNDPGYVITFGVMLAVGLVVGTLAARAREQAERAAEREARTSALFVLSRELGSARSAEDVAAAGCRHAHDLLGLDTVIAAPLPGLQPGSSALGVLGQAGVPDWFDERERAVARW